MRTLSRRQVVGGSIGLAAGAVARPYIANAAASTASVWWNQGFIPEEDSAFRAMVADYEKQSGNKIDFSLIPLAPLMQKIVSSLTSGDVPDVASHTAQAITLIPQNAWKDKLVDLSDIVDPWKSQIHPMAYLASRFYNNVTRTYGVYQAPVIMGPAPFHIWNSLVEKAGLKIVDAPKTWDAFWDYFKPAQTALRSQGMRDVYSLGLQATTNAPTDGNHLFEYFLAANGGLGIVTPDGQPHLDDPKVRDAVLKSITYITTAFKQGYAPPEALRWNDADDNKAFHAKQIVMDLDGNLSTELALIHDPEKYNDVVTLGLPNDNAGNPMASALQVSGLFVPKGARNIDVAKDFVKYMIEPKITGAYTKAGLGRWLPTFPNIVKNDPWWTDPKDPHRLAYVRQGVFGATAAYHYCFNPGWSEANAEQIWGVAHASVIRDNVSPEAATETALTRLGAILAKYPMVPA